MSPASTPADPRRAQLAQRLRAARDAAGLSQQQVVDAVPDLPRTGLSDVERGVREVSALELADLAAVYGVAVAILLDQEQTEPDPGIAGLTASDRAELATFADFLRYRRRRAGRRP